MELIRIKEIVSVQFEYLQLQALTDVEITSKQVAQLELLRNYTK